MGISKIRKNIAARLLGKEYVILRSEEYDRLRSEFSRKISELEQRLGSVLIDEAEYCFLKQFAETLTALEKRLHESDNADEILKATYQTACEFYEADWAGFLELDMDSKIWWPFSWYSVKNNDMTTTYLHDFEEAAIVPRWISAMDSNRPIVVKDREEIKTAYPDEYALYERVKLYSVIAVPVKPRPCGFLAVRNPRRYVEQEYADMLQLLAFVALVNINDKMTQRMMQMADHAKGLRSETDVYIKLFGGFELQTIHGVLRPENMERSTSALLLSYLALRTDRATTAVRLERVFYPGEKDAIGKVYNIVSAARNDLKIVQAKNLLPSADTVGYHFNREYHVTTDLTRFDELYDEIMSGSSSYHIFMGCSHICEMYTGDIWLDIADEEIDDLRQHYHQKYFTVLDKLLTFLSDSGDFNGVCKTAEQGLKIEQGHPDMYYWLIRAYENMKQSKAADNTRKTAQYCLSEEDYADLMLKLKNTDT